MKEAIMKTIYASIKDTCPGDIQFKMTPITNFSVPENKEVESIEVTIVYDSVALRYRSDKITFHHADGVSISPDSFFVLETGDYSLVGDEYYNVLDRFGITQAYRRLEAQAADKNTSIQVPQEDIGSPKTAYSKQILYAFPKKWKRNGETPVWCTVKQIEVKTEGFFQRYTLSLQESSETVNADECYLSTKGLEISDIRLLYLAPGVHRLVADERYVHERPQPEAHPSTSTDLPPTQEADLAEGEVIPTDGIVTNPLDPFKEIHTKWADMVTVLRHKLTQDGIVLKLQDSFPSFNYGFNSQYADLSIPVDVTNVGCTCTMQLTMRVTQNGYYMDFYSKKPNQQASRILANVLNIKYCQ